MPAGCIPVPQQLGGRNLDLWRLPLSWACTCRFFPLLAVIAGSPDIRRQPAESQRHTRRDLLERKKDGFPLRRQKWDGDGGRERTLWAPLLERTSPTYNPYLLLAGTLFLVFPSNRSFVTSLRTDCSRLAISLKQSNKYETPGRVCSEHLLLI